MSVKSQILSLLICKEWVDVSHFEILFPPGTEGHQSWPQRLRELREDGYQIDKRLKAGSQHTYEYRLHRAEKPPLTTEATGQMCF